MEGAQQHAGDEAVNYKSEQDSMARILKLAEAEGWRIALIQLMDDDGLSCTGRLALNGEVEMLVVPPKLPPVYMRLDSLDGVNT